MSVLRPHRRFATWLTLVALVLATLAPGIARALTFAQGELAPWGQICTTSADGSHGSGLATEPTLHLLDHCPFCSLHSDDLGLPPAPAASADAPALSHAVPRLFLLSARPLFAWAPAQARAPPLAC